MPHKRQRQQDSVFRTVRSFAEATGATPVVSAGFVKDGLDYRRWGQHRDPRNRKLENLRRSEWVL
jgi:hypothetical protein